MFALKFKKMYLALAQLVEFLMDHSTHEQFNAIIQIY